MTLTAAPVLKTARLVLRGPQKSDLVPLTAMITGSARMDTMGGNGTEEDGWRTMMSAVGHWHWHGYGFFTLVERESDLPAGRVGILNHHGWPAPELAWHVFDGFEGKSVAYEAACAVRHWAGEALGLQPLISLIGEDNPRSQALAKRLGASEERRMDWKGYPTIQFRHLAHDDPRAVSQWEEVAA